MSNLINGLPPAPANPNGGADIFGPPNPLMFGGGAPAPAAPAPYPQTPPAPAPAGYMQPPLAPAPMPQQPQPQYLQQQPTGAPAPEYPMAPIPTQYPMQPAAPPMPDWAQDVIDAAQALQNPPAGDDWPERGQTWGEFRKAVQQEAQQIANNTIQAYQAEQVQAAQNAASMAAVENQRYDMTEMQLQQLGLLPAVMDPNNPNDPGRLAKRELYAYTIAMGGQGPENLGPAATALKALHDSGVYFDVAQNKLIRRGSQSAAAQAPIAGGAPVVGGQGQGYGPAGPTQSQLGMGLSALAEIGMNQLPQG